METSIYKVGDMIDGKYSVLDRLSVGGMGEIYKVRHVHLDDIRVIKVMRPGLSDTDVAHRRFVHEAKMATLVKHSNVAILYDFSTLPGGLYYMVWEYIRGADIGRIIRAKGRFDPREAVDLAIQTLRGLAAVHAHGIIHRDVATDNIMVTADLRNRPQVKLIDLGIAKHLMSEGSVSLTQPGYFVGKLRYCSPEQAGLLQEGEHIDHRADIYSFGIVFYEMIAGKTPFNATTPQAFILKHATEAPRAFKQFDPSLDVSEELERIVFKAIEKNRERRFQSAEEMAQALKGMRGSIAASSAAVQRTLQLIHEAGGGKLPLPAGSSAAPAASASPAGPGLPALPGRLSGSSEAGAPQTPSREHPTIVNQTPSREHPAMVPRTPSREHPGRGHLDGYRDVPASRSSSGSPPVSSLTGIAQPPPQARSGGIDESRSLGSTPPASRQSAIFRQTRGWSDGLLDAPESNFRRMLRVIGGLVVVLLLLVIFLYRTPSLSRKSADSSGSGWMPPSMLPTTGSDGVSPKQAGASGGSAGETPRGVSSSPGVAAGTASEPMGTSPDAAAAQSPSPSADGPPLRLAGGIGTTPLPSPSPPEVAPRSPSTSSLHVRRGELVEAGTPGLVPPRALSTPAPAYPTRARKYGLEGVVVLSILVGETGDILDVKVLRGLFGDPELAVEAVRTGRRYRFTPATLGGVPVKTWTSVPVTFSLAAP